MNKQKLAAFFGAAILLGSLAVHASAADAVNFGDAAGGMMREAESMIGDVMPGAEGGSGMIGSDSDAESSGTLGDTSDVTSGDGVVDGSADGFLGDESDMTADSTREPDTETETAATSSGEESRGLSVMGVVLTLVIIAAVAALLFALMPKRRQG